MSCHACWVRAERQVQRQRPLLQPPHVEEEGVQHDVQLPPHSSESTSEPVREPEEQDTPRSPAPLNSLVQQQIHVDLPTIMLPNYKRAANTSSHCIFSGCANRSWHLIPSFIKQMLIKELRYYVPACARVCETHLYSNEWHLLPEISNCGNNFTANQIEDCIAIAARDANTFDFENVHEMPNHICHYWTGLRSNEFLSLVNEVPALNSVVSPRTSLAIYLIKLRTGDSNQRLSTLFNMPRSTVELHMKSVRNCLTEYFVPLHIGLHHITPEDAARRNLYIPNALFGNPEASPREMPLILICDGTYIYVEKSSNYLYQKRTYSLHKYSNLVKPFLITCCDGHILDVIGPYAATQTDAEIMIDLFLDENRPLRSYLRINDILLLDRGFRDSIPLLESCNIKVFKPETLNAGETQLTTIQANKTRFVTLCRWVVEVVNGRFKRDFKIFRQDFFNSASRHLMSDFKIAAALLNRFHPLIQDRPDCQEIVRRALHYYNVPNHLAQYINDNNYNRRRVTFIYINAIANEIDPFPVFTYSELILLALGTYQLKQARSYYGEHVRQNGTYMVEVCAELEYVTELVAQVGGNSPYLLRGRIKSRHVTHRQYFVYLLVDRNPIGNNPFDALLGYCCSCVSGNRTVGCCSHVMTVVWYLGWARHQDHIEAPASFLDSVLLTLDDE